MLRGIVELNFRKASGKTLLAVWGCALILFLLPSITFANEPQKNVLLLNSDDTAMPANVLVNQAFRATLRDGWKSPIQIYDEGQDSFRIPNEKYEAELVALLKRKYEGVHLDLIFAVGPPVLRFLLKHRGEVFSDTPIVFMAVDQSRVANLDLGSNVTGVSGKVELAPTLDLALALHPQTQSVVVVAGNGSLDQGLLEQARKEFRAYEGRAAFTYLSGLTLEDVRKRLAVLPDKTIVIFLAFNTDSAGKVYENSEVISQLASSSAAPVYGESQTVLGFGIVGGRLISLEALGSAAGQMALRILAGESAQSIAPQTTANVTMFDWRQLRRWGIDEAKLPPGSIVRYKEFSVWELYKWRIIGALAFGVFEALLIAVLLVERRRRQRANVELDERVRFETLLSRLSAEFTDLPASKVDAVVKQWVDRLEDLLGDAAISFFEVSGSGGEVSTNPSDDASSAPRALDVRAVKDDRWCLAQLRSGTTINLPREPSALSSENLGEKLNADLKSLLAIPVVVNGSTFALAIETTRSRRTWPKHFESQLRLVCEIFAGAVERKRSGEELEKTRNDLAHVARLTAMGEMAASIAHEVNQPLAAIATYGDACVRLLSGESPNVKKSLEAINHIISDSMRASEVIKRIRALVKKTDHENTPQDLNQIILEMVALMEADVLSKSVELKLHLAPDLPLVLGDRVELQQVMLNLILNGIEAMSAIIGRDRELTITSSMNGGGQVLVTVQDSGVGLDPEQARRIFDPFVTTKPSGLGMGLSISRTILEAHGGRLWAEPNQGPGARFQFTLPVAGASDNGH
jgi:C4-dicarboxylate-specific signal transduction histidine kinase/ABC-type uncharacterized transport system substrate-binding protein